MKEGDEKRKMRLAYLISRYPAISHTFILREVIRLGELGFEIEVASINDPDRPAEAMTAEDRAESERTYYVKRDGASGAIGAHLATLLKNPLGYGRGLWYALRLGGADLKKMLYGVFYFIEAVMIGRWMQRRGLDHLHVHFATPAATVGLVVKRVFRTGLSVTVHGPDEFYDAPGYLLREKIEGSDFMLCIGTYARSQLMKLSDVSQWGKFEIAPLGVFPEVFTPVKRSASNGSFRVLCVGRLTPAKGQHILVAAIERLARAGRDVMLTFVGDGPDRKSLEADVNARGLQSRVVFAGAVNQDRIREYYAEADVFALASFAEGIPIVLMEAMAMETPVISTRITGIPELIRDGRDGLLVAPSDDEELAGAMARLMDDPESRVELGRAGRLRVMEKYDLGRNIERLAAILRRRLGERGEEESAEC